MLFATSIGGEVSQHVKRIISIKCVHIIGSS